MRSSPLQSRPNVSGGSLPLFEKDFSTNRFPGSFNDDSLVRFVITSAIKSSAKSREEIAEAMQEMLAIPVTARMIASFTAESKELHRWPGAWDRAFCAATGDDRLLKCRVELAGYRVIQEVEADLIELGRHYLLQKRSEQSIAILERKFHGRDL